MVRVGSMASPIFDLNCAWPSNAISSHTSSGKVTIAAHDLTATEHAALTSALLAIYKAHLVEALILTGDATARRELMALAPPVTTPEGVYDAHAEACLALLDRIAAAVPRERTVGWRDAAAIAHLEAVLRDADTIIGA